MGFLGLDIEAVRRLSRQLHAQSDEVALATKELTTVVESTDWIGADHTAFLHEWQTQHAPALRRSSELLREAGDYAHQGGAAQEQASR